MRSPELNVPEQARSGVSAALAGAVTVGNHTSKINKFCSANSEDAVTWTVTAGLLQTGELDAFVGQRLGQPRAVLLWGHPVSGSEARGLRSVLLRVSDDLGEDENWRSEPDIILLWPQSLTIIEAKYGGANDRKPNYRGYSTYLGRPGLFAAADAEVAKEGSYQLARNWVMGTIIAEHLGAMFRLVNLGPPGIGTSATTFASLLVQTPTRQFEHRTWGQVLEAAAPPAWLDAFAKERRL
jgi:hypothetical protein